MSSFSPPPPPPQQPPSNHHHTTIIHLLPPLITAVITLSLLTLLLLFLYRRLSHLLHLSKPQSLSSTPPFPRRFSYSTLRRATASFSPTRRLGQGGFGSVFAGTLTLTKPPNKIELPIAVKLMDCGSLQGEREFHNEIALANKLVNSERVVKLVGFSTSRKRRRMCLVYELMSNGNLQDCLLHKKCDELMEWSARFRVAVEVASGLAFLHHHCDPPVIHGDVKPSNVLLDDHFSAKIADFGLARLKLVENNNTNNSTDVVVNIGEIKGNSNGNDNSNSNNVVEDNVSVMETESVTTTVGFEEGSVGVNQSPIGVGLMAVETSPEMVTAAASPSEFWDKGSDLEGGQFDRVSEGKSGKEGTKVNGNNGKGKVAIVGKEWGYKVENEGKVKDYVMEWIGTEVVDKEERVVRGDWVGGAGSSSNVGNGKVEKKKGKKKLEWWASMDDRKILKKDKRRPAREWWKEEYTEELAKKKKKKKKNQGTMSDNEEHWWPRDDEMYAERKKKNKGRTNSRSSVDWWLDGLSGELWKGRQTSHDSMSGEIPKSGGISSTPSMRGTVCYIAPEYSSGGDLSEKCDVYSFGVLLLVLIAGRRPLQVTGSPMSEFHRANLISWARQLARSGKLLELVDKKIRSLNKEQAQLCIVVALVCLQKSAARRPSMKEVVGVLTGELGPPQLPMEYTQSPSTKYPLKSRKKLR